MQAAVSIFICALLAALAATLPAGRSVAQVPNGRSGQMQQIEGHSIVQQGGAIAGACTKPEFESAVDGAAASLRDLNARNTPGFQDKLRLLRERRNWSPDEFMEKAAPFVQDEQIAAFDQRSNDLLAKLNSMGEAGAAANTPDCQLLGELRATMKSLIDTQIEKWAYMFAKIERGLVN